MEGVVIRDVFAERLEKPGGKRSVDLVAVRPQIWTQPVKRPVRLSSDRCRLGYSRNVISRMTSVDIVNGVQQVGKARDLSSNVL